MNSDLDQQLDAGRALLSELIGTTVTRVSLESFGSVRILLDTYELHIEGAWELSYATSEFIDRSTPLDERAAFRLWKTLGASIQSVQIAASPDVELTMSFSNGSLLNMPCDNDGYEDWSITGYRWKIFSEGTRLTIFGP